MTDQTKDTAATRSRRSTRSSVWPATTPASRPWRASRCRATRRSWWPSSPTWTAPRPPTTPSWMPRPSGPSTSRRPGRQRRLPGQGPHPEDDRPHDPQRASSGASSAVPSSASSSRPRSSPGRSGVGIAGAAVGKAGNVLKKSAVADELASVIAPGTSGIVALVAITAVDAVKQTIPDAKVVKSAPVDAETADAVVKAAKAAATRPRADRVPPEGETRSLASPPSSASSVRRHG